MKLFNSLSSQLEEFVSIEDKKVRLYVCGITPYDTTHLGHAFTYISFDLLVRFLGFLGYKVTYTQNVTDINDRDNDILKRAQQQNTTWDKLAQFWTDKFLTDMHSLNWIIPTNYLLASEQIPSMVKLIEQIIANEFGYEVHSGVYLDTAKVKDFGKLSKLTHEQMLVKAKEFEEDITNSDKRNPLDITLWRPSTPNQPVHIPSFDSPWGKGRPGWHIECSAMVIESLGSQIDFHGGGIDLIYPHHESEIAQSESGTRMIPFAKYWLHTGTVYINRQKMSKSLGNLILISDLLKKYSSNAIRWVLLSHHYREKWDYDEKEFANADTLFTHIISSLQTPIEQENSSDKNYMQLATDLLSNDLQSPKLLEEFQNAVSMTLSKQQAKEITEILTMLGFIL